MPASLMFSALPANAGMSAPGSRRDLGGETLMTVSVTKQDENG